MSPTLVGEKVSAEHDPAEALEHATRRFLQGDLVGALAVVAELDRWADTSDDPRMVFVQLQRAAWLREAGQHEPAAQIMATAEAELAALSPGLRRAGMAWLHVVQGLTALRTGDLEQADRLLTQAVEESDDEQFGRFVLSDGIANLGAVRLQQGRYEDAQTLLLRAAEIDRRQGDARGLASDLNMLGTVYALTGDVRQAGFHYDEAARTAREAGLLKEIADASANQAGALRQAGRLHEAELTYQAAARLYSDGGFVADLASTRANLGLIARERGLDERARRLFQQAYETLRDVDAVQAVKVLVDLALIEVDSDPGLASEHSRAAVEKAETLALPDALWSAYAARARIRAEAAFTSAPDGDDGDEAVFKVLADEVLPDYRRAADVIELLRSGIGRPEERQFLLHDKEDLYSIAIDLCLMLDLGDEAFRFSERARARAFLDVVGADRIRARTIDHPLLARREELTRALLSSQAPDEDGRRAILDELQRVRARIIADAPPLAAVTEAQVPGVDDILTGLEPDTALVEFHVVPDRMLHLFLYMSTGLAAVVSVEMSDLSALIERFRAEIESGPPGAPTGEELFAILFGDILDELDGIARLVVVPHRELHTVPFAALWNRDDDPDHSRRHLWERFLLTTLPSAAFLPVCQALPRADRVASADRPTPPLALVLGDPSGDLPYAAEEARAAASHLGVEPLIGAAATRRALLEAPEGHAVIHVACHGEFNAEDPLLSGIQLADGLVTVQDILEHSFDSGLLVLSGCVTGLGERRPGDELVGLAQAAATARVPSVITTLWETFDYSSCLFFERFYDALATGDTIDVAMRRARGHLNANGFTSPQHWAPFVLLGDWR
jgi:CHAT domain-containing protein/tetratricopeptide (TPR) repeat protein